MNRRAFGRWAPAVSTASESGREEDQEQRGPGLRRHDPPHGLEARIRTSFTASDEDLTIALATCG